MIVETALNSDLFRLPAIVMDVKTNHKPINNTYRESGQLTFCAHIKRTTNIQVIIFKNI